MPDKPIPTLERANRRTDERVASLRAKLRKAIANLKAEGRDDEWLRAVFGGGARGRKRMERPLASDLWLRQQSTHIRIDLMLAHWRERPSGRCYMFVTFVDDSGNTLMELPQLNFAAFRQKVYRALNDSGLNAVVALELQALTNYPQAGHGKAMMLHAHAIVWTDDPDWQDDPEQRFIEWAVEIGRRDSWTCGFGAEPVLPLIIGDTEGDMATVAAYITKVPSDGSRTILNPETGRYRMRTIVGDYQPNQALRVMEVLSQIELNQLIFAVSKGNEIVRPWRKQLLEMHRNHRPNAQRGPAARADIAAGWAAIRESHGNPNHRAAVEWLSGNAKPPTIHFTLDDDGAAASTVHERMAQLRAAMNESSPLDDP